MRDRLTIDEAAHLGAQLPLIVRGIYCEGWRPAANPKACRSIDEFYGEIGGRMRGVQPVNLEEVTRTVFKVLDRHVTAGEIQDVREMLPQDLRPQ